MNDVFKGVRRVLINANGVSAMKRRGSAKDDDCGAKREAVRLGMRVEAKVI
jgi:hypothetical protein